MKKTGLTLMLGLFGLAVAGTAGSGCSNKRQAAKQGAGDAMGAGEGRWGGPGKADGRRGRGPQRMLRLLDTDGDGVISKEELAKASTSIGKLDKNGDGKLTPDELRPKWRRGQWGRRGGHGMRGRMGGGHRWRGGMGGGHRWRGGMGGRRHWRGGMGGGQDCPQGPGCGQGWRGGGGMGGGGMGGGGVGAMGGPATPSANPEPAKPAK
jgi:EF hand